MAVNGNFILRWEIDDATARLETGKVESGVFDEGGFKWTIAMIRRSNTDETADFVLRCDLDNYREWKCEADMIMVLLMGPNSEGSQFCNKTRFGVSEISPEYLCNSILWWRTMTGPTYKINDKLTFEFRFNIISSVKGQPIADPARFTTPNGKSNVVLKIGDDKLHVSKEYLAIHSPVFDILFFGEFAENGKEGIEIKDVVYEEFIDLLHVIYPGRVMITDSTVLHVLTLGDRFQMERVVDLAERHLIVSKKFNTAEKLRLADLFRLGKLRDNRLQSFSTVREIGTLESTPEFAQFSDAMKAAICGRTMKLIKEME